MTRLIFSLILTSLCSGLLCQVINVDSVFEPRLSGEVFHMKSGFIGKQFYNEDWTPATLKLNSGELIYNKKLKYNSLLDELIWLQDNSFRQIKLEKHFISEFWFNTSPGVSAHFKKVKAKFQQMTDSAEIFIEVLQERPAELLVFRSVRMEGHEDEVKNGVLYTHEILKPFPIYFLRLPDQSRITLQKIRKRILLKALNENNRAKIKEIIQQNHLSLRNEKDLIQLVNLIK